LAILQRYSSQFKNQASKLQGEMTKFVSEQDILRSSLAI